MEILIYLHILFVIIWFGSAAGEIILECVLWRTKSASMQRAYIDLHQITDRIVEGPALIGTLLTGVGLLWKKGYFLENTQWPHWFEDKLICSSVVMIINILCIIFVFLRAKRAKNILSNTAPLEFESVKIWHYSIVITLIGIPFALAALWFAVNKGSV